MDVWTSPRSATPRSRSAWPFGRPSGDGRMSWTGWPWRCTRLSTRDIEDALRQATGDDMVLSRSLVSRITETLWEELEALAQRDLSRLDVVYILLDAVYESLREQAGLKERILVSRGILSDGSKVLIHLSLGNKESYEDWPEHLRDLVRRGLGIPLTVTTDGAAGGRRGGHWWPRSSATSRGSTTGPDGTPHLGI